MAKSQRKRVLLAKLETTYGTDSSPTSTNAILCSDLNLSPIAGNDVDRNFIKAWYGSSGKLRVESFGKLTFKTELAGSGTAGTAPQWNELIRSCNFSGTAISSAVTGSAQAGAASTITLAAGASANDNEYVGLKISLTSGTGSGQTNEIIAYNGTTKVATVRTAWTTNPAASTGYSIAAGYIYTLNSNFSKTASTSATIYCAYDGTKHVLLGARGTFSLELSVKGIPMISWEFIGILGTASETTNPTVDYTGWQVPVPALTANTGDFTILNLDNVVMESLSIAINNELSYRTLVGDESVLISNRNITGNTRIEAPAISTYNFFDKVQQGTQDKFYVRHGSTAGNTIVLASPKIQVTSAEYAESAGSTMLDLQTVFIPSATVGNDELRIVAR